MDSIFLPVPDPEWVLHAQARSKNSRKANLEGIDEHRSKHQKQLKSEGTQEKQDWFDDMSSKDAVLQSVESLYNKFCEDRTLKMKKAESQARKEKRSRKMKEIPTHSTQTFYETSTTDHELTGVFELAASIFGYILSGANCFSVSRSEPFHSIILKGVPESFTTPNLKNILECHGDIAQIFDGRRTKDGIILLTFFSSAVALSMTQFLDSILPDSQIAAVCDLYSPPDNPGYTSTKVAYPWKLEWTGPSPRSDIEGDISEVSEVREGVFNVTFVDCREKVKCIRKNPAMASEIAADGNAVRKGQSLYRFFRET